MNKFIFIIEYWVNTPDGYDNKVIRVFSTKKNAIKSAKEKRPLGKNFKILRKEIRTTQELLRLLINNINALEKGLCLFIIEMHKKHKLISKKERELLFFEIEKEFKKRGMVKIKKGDFYWPEGYKKPRLEFLESLIKKI